MDENGTNERVVATRSGPSPTGDYSSELAPASSPDGSRLALYSDSTIAIVTVDGIATVASVAPLYVTADGTQNGMLIDDAHSPSWHD